MDGRCTGMGRWVPLLQAEVSLLGEAQKRSLWFAGLAAEWRFSPRWSALLQYDAHSPLLSADLAALSRPTGILSMALRWRAAPDWWIDFGFSEDAVVDSAPDITFLLGIGYSPGVDGRPVPQPRPPRPRGRALARCRQNDCEPIPNPPALTRQTHLPESRCESPASRLTTDR